MAIILNHSVFYFGYTYYQASGTPMSINSPVHGVVVFDEIGAKKGDKVKGKLALCYGEKNGYVAGTFEIDRCLD